MIATILSLILAFRSSAAPSSAPPSPTPDDLSSKLSKRVSNYNLGVFTLLRALIRVSNDFQIPMGIAWVDSPATRAELPFAWKDATVQEIIENIAGTEPGYQVCVENGVVHVLPPIPDSQNFLKLKLGDFSAHDDYIEVASFKLHTLVTPIKGSYQISIGGTGDSKVDIELKNPTTESALDALTVASNRKIWVVAFSNDSRLTSRGFRRTKSLWTEDPVPDEEQPVWALFRWGDPPPPNIAQTTN